MDRSQVPPRKTVDGVSPVNVRPGRRKGTVSVEYLCTEQDERRRLREIFDRYRTCQEEFTAKEWEVVYLCFHEGLSQEEMAACLGVKRSAVSNRIRRARRKKEAYERRLRAEQYALMRKELDS